MRIHGTKVIHRREDTPYQTDYHNYLPQLRTDFFKTCGYCGKHEMISHSGMEPDHFVPDHIDHSKQCDYFNLIYSCFTCNRKKLGKWPTKDKDKPHDGKMGFVDPGSPEYDLHLGRSDDGTIECYTDVGRYMFQNVFKFDIRPTKAIWQASQLFELAQKLKDVVQNLPPEKQHEYISMTSELFNLQEYLFECRE